jgi:hypothetical protein
MLYQHQCLPAPFPYTLCSSTFYALCAMSLLSTIPLLCISDTILSLLLHTLITLNNNLHLFSVMRIYTIYAPSSSSMHSASELSSLCHGSTHRVIHCHSTFSLLHSLKPQKENCILLLSIPHMLLISEFYLSLHILFVSHYAYCNFPFFTVELIFLFRTTNHTQSLHVSFIYYNPVTSRYGALRPLII